MKNRFTESLKLNNRSDNKFNMRIGHVYNGFVWRLKIVGAAVYKVVDTPAAHIINAFEYIVAHLEYALDCSERSARVLVAVITINIALISILIVI